MNHFLSIIIILVSLNINAKVIKNSIEPSEREKQCFNSIIQSTAVKNVFPNIQSTIAWNFVVETAGYCGCEAKKMAQEWKEQEADWIAYQFKDKTKMLQKRDYCSLKNYKTKEHMHLFYRSKYEQWFSPQIVSKINDHVMGASIMKVAGETKWMNYLECAHGIITETCSKMDSLSVTFSCIKENFNPQTYDVTHRSCINNLHNDIIIKDLYEGEMI